MILGLLAGDRTCSEAAMVLGCSRSYVYNEVQAIKQKLDVDTIHGAVAKALREEML